MFIISSVISRGSPLCIYWSLLWTTFNEKDHQDWTMFNEYDCQCSMKQIINISSMFNHQHIIDVQWQYQQYVINVQWIIRWRATRKPGHSGQNCVAAEKERRNRGRKLLKKGGGKNDLEKYMQRDIKRRQI